MSLKISLSGPAGSGKSSLMHAIVKKYGMETADVGQVFRQRAVERGLTISEYDRLVEQNPQEDIEMEQEFKKLIEDCSGDIMVSRRVGFYLCPTITSIWLDVTPEEGAQRIFLDDRGQQEKKYTSLEEVLETNLDRMERTKERLLKIYHVDFTDTSHYTKVIDTTGKTFEQNFKILDEYIQTLKK